VRRTEGEGGSQLSLDFRSNRPCRLSGMSQHTTRSDSTRAALCISNSRSVTHCGIDCRSSIAIHRPGARYGTSRRIAIPRGGGLRRTHALGDMVVDRCCYGIPRLARVLQALATSPALVGRPLPDCQLGTVTTSSPSCSLRVVGCPSLISSSLSR
jgi:hypothetical protein